MGRGTGGNTAVLRLGKYALDMGSLPASLDPQPLPFERVKHAL